ncbi:type I polyketide synthase [Shewanella sp. LC6]|jgi:acyl transferase domain-containing protein|uniref:type I polyketide synthase n=1 Tax=unclassified Shewanella TaxID=196818 RepID=UPI000B51C94B|nr:MULTISPECIES: type I polyketide synthase [unclassified Shewanella]ASF14978.1 KR domain-containing protein [Shewanella sp. FDAARGOS_354]QQK60753.1 type I polyketide synthase [Shewanella sp. LC6]TPE57910.1 type I polyketide synthase [Shewanella sp. LC2]
MSHTPSQPQLSTDEKADKRLNKRLKDMPIAIVGMASIFANSRYLNKFWDLICDKIDAITDVPESHWSIDDYYDADKSKADKSYCKRGGFMPEVDFNPMEFGLPPNILELTDSSQLLSLVVAKEVLQDANLPDDYDRDRIGITLGIGGGQKLSHSLNARLQYPVLKKVFKSSGLSDEDSELLIKKFQDQYVHWEENSFPGSLGNVIAGRIANRFDLGGMNCVVDAACAGSLAAMRMALTELTEGRSDMMITGGVCTDNSPYMYMSFSKTPAFTTNEQIQPFDIDSKGMMIGEGIGMVALKRLDDAERDGDRIYAVIKGVGASSDGKFKSIYAPRPEGQAKALERAYDDAGFAPHTVGLIEAHGTGTAAGDVAEFNGLTSVFSKDNEQLQHIALGSVKSQVGHTKSTAGTAGVIKAALALHHKVLPPTINVSQPNPKLNIARSPFYLNTEARPWIQRSDDTPRRAGVSSFGFGGTNFHLVLEEYHPEHARDDAYRQRSVAQSWLFAAADKTALLAELKNALQQATAAKAELSDAHFVAFAKSYALRELAPQSARLGFIAKDYAQLQTLLTQAIAQLESNSADGWQLPSGISFRAQALVKDNHKVAALFAGQGSQYLNMGLEIANNFPELRRHIHASDKVFSDRGEATLSNVLYPIPAFDDESRKAQESALTNTLYAQSAIGAISMAQYALFIQAGFTADMLAGHSFGELSALCAAGVISMDDYIKLAFERGQAMAQSPLDADSSRDAGIMYAVILKQKQDIETINDCLAQFDDVKIANYNSPTQLVIAGATTATQQAAKAIGELGFKAIALPVSGAFHTPLVAHAQKPFSEAIDKAQFNTPKIALYANGTGKLHPADPNAIKTAFKEHMLQSVHFSEQLEAMYAAGARVFVEFGPKNILQKLTENTLAAQLNELCLISINPNPKADSDSQLRSAAVQLAVAGVTLGEIDPYQAELIAPATPSAMNIKLNATNYISPATRNKMVDSLQSGKITSQVQYVDRLVEKVVEKVVEKPVIVEKILEKVVEVEKPVAQNSNNIQQQTSAQPASFAAGQANQDALSAFFAAQTQAAQLHQQFLAIPQQYGDTVSSLMAEQAKMASLGIAIPESLQRSMELFHQHQAQTLKSHAEFMQLQTSSSQAALALLGQMPAPQVQAPIQVAAPVAVAVATPVVPAQAPVVQALAAEPKVTAVPVSEPKVQQPQVQTVAAATRALSEKSVVQQIEHAMLSVVADKTGYPVEMLELSMDMEADLGIDSIKRVEILGTVQDQLPSLPELSPEDLAECRTLGEIVALFSQATPVTAVTASPQSITQIAVAASTAVSNDEIERTMMAVVADKTGYPVEMLELSMDMEADLGIDSIKRVEILGTVQDELPNLPELSPEDLAECRTLGEIVALFSQAAPVVSTAVVAAATASHATQSAVAKGAAVSNDEIERTMMAVVADKTGYPVEMLELSMDMEADLGIDSIKRVEILGTVQDELPNLPELSPEDLAECRTLGEIVALFSQAIPLVSTAVTAAATVSHATQSAVATNAAVSNDEIERTMMAVVADKTGYPVEMLELNMDMEADLGIDSIKRVEILGTVQDELPNLPELSPEDLAECRTLGEIVALFSQAIPLVSTAVTAAATVSHATQNAVAASAAVSNGAIERTMMAVVADKTGYPVEMLELSMDMEADLGIDSIKRVEILGTVQDQLPNLPELSPEDLAECRTLGEIVALYAGSQASSEALQQNHAAPIQEAITETVEEIIDLPPHSEVMLKKLPAAAELARIIATSDVQLTANSYVVIGDDGHNAGVIAEKLHAQGVKVAVVRSPKTVVASASPLDSHIANFTLKAIDDESICEVINQIEALGQIAGFIHLQPQHKSVADKSAGLVLADEAKASVEQAFLFAKHLQPLLTERDYCRFVTVSRIDGGFGYIGMDESAGALISQSELNQAALSGLTKTLNHEWPGVVCRALDIAPNLDAKTVANAVVQEYYLQDAPVEVGIDSELERTTLVAGSAALRHPPAALSNADKILVTGGAKGVTFECALSLAKRCKAHFILAGRSAHQGIPAWAQGKNRNELKAAAIAHLQSLGDKPTPKQVDALVWPVQSSLEISHALQAFEAVGASAEYLSLDVNDPDAIASTIAPISALSPITGIIHGAGVLADKHIQDKTLSELERVYGTKVTGLNNLLSALDLSQLTLIALFSSAAGFYGNTGQSDYAMSNDILNKAALQLAQQLPQAKVMSFDWGPWDGGMVNPALKKMFIDRGVYVIPLKAGAELFASQLLSDTGAQLLVGTDMQGNTANTVEAASAKKPEADLTTALDPQPMAQTVPQSIRVMRSLDPKRMSFIEDHCINGHAVLPTVCAIDWMREAAKAHLGKTVSVSDYRLLKGIIFDEVLLARDAPIELELMLTPLADATQQSTEALTALISFEGRPQYQAVLVAQTDDTADAQRFEVGELHSLMQEMPQQPAIADRESLYSDGTLFHGPRLQGISEVLAFDDQQLIAKVALPTVALDDCGEFAPNLEDKGTQPFAEDLLLQAMLVWARLKYQAASLPSAIGEFVSYSPLAFGEKAVLVLDVIKHSSRSLEANIALYHQDGRLSCEMKRAKVTISKTLNQAFLANKPQQLAQVQASIQNMAEVSVK